jgi:hypothetical protein
MGPIKDLNFPSDIYYVMSADFDFFLIDRAIGSPREGVQEDENYGAKKPPFIDVTAVPHLPECSMTPRVQRV